MGVRLVGPDDFLPNFGVVEGVVVVSTGKSIGVGGIGEAIGDMSLGVLDLL